MTLYTYEVRSLEGRLLGYVEFPFERAAQECCQISLEYMSPVAYGRAPDGSPLVIHEPFTLTETT